MRNPLFLILLACASAAAPERAAGEEAGLRRLEDACSNEITLLCPQTARKGRLPSCLREHEDALTTPCQNALNAFSAAEPGPAAPSAPAGSAVSAPAPEKPAPAGEIEGRLVRVTGTAYLHTALQPEGEFIPAEPGTPLAMGDLVRTGTDGSAEIALDGRSLIALAPNTDFLVDSLSASDGQFRLEVGRLVALLEKLASGRRLSFRTPTAVAAVRGTELGITQDEADKPGTVGVFGEGRVSVASAEGGPEVALGPGQESQTSPGKPPSPPKALSALSSQKEALEAVKKRLPDISKGWIPSSPEQRRVQRGKLASIKPISADKLGNVREDRRRRSSPSKQPGRSPKGRP